MRKLIIAEDVLAAAIHLIAHAVHAIPANKVNAVMDALKGLEELVDSSNEKEDK